MTASAPPSVALRAGALETTIEGGALLSVTSLRHHGEELLVAPGALPRGYRVHGRAAGITFLHPWANRIGAERFTTAGAEVVLAPGDPAIGRDGGGLPLHGLALEGTWFPREAGPATCVVDTTFAATPAFPWEHEVEVELTVAAPARVACTTTVRALGYEPVPVAFGWHPYLALPGTPRAGWRLGLPDRRRLALDARGIPTGPVVAERREDAPLGTRTFDDGYEGLPGGASLVLADAGRRIVVDLAAGYPAGQVFAPGDAEVVSLEPMTAPTDALRTGRGLRFATVDAPFVARFVVDIT